MRMIQLIDRGSLVIEVCGDRALGESKCILNKIHDTMNII